MGNDRGRDARLLEDEFDYTLVTIDLTTAHDSTSPVPLNVGKWDRLSVQRVDADVRFAYNDPTKPAFLVGTGDFSLEGIRSIYVTNEASSRNAAVLEVVLIKGGAGIRPARDRPGSGPEGAVRIKEFATSGSWVDAEADENSTQWVFRADAGGAGLRIRFDPLLGDDFELPAGEQVSFEFDPIRQPFVFVNGDGVIWNSRRVP